MLRVEYRLSFTLEGKNVHVTFELLWTLRNLTWFVQSTLPVQHTSAAVLLSVLMR